MNLISFLYKKILFFSAIAVASVGSAFAQTAPLACDNNTSYLIGSPNNATASTITFVTTDTGTPTGTSLSLSNQSIYNGLAYNPQDGLLYGFVQGQLGGSYQAGSLVTIDATGTVSLLPTPTPNGTTNIPVWGLDDPGKKGVNPSAGVIEGNNFYFFGRNRVNGDSYLVTVDLTDMSYTDIKLSSSIWIQDFAYSAQTGLLYATTKDNVLSIDPATGAVNSTVAPLTGLRATGGAWTDINEDIYFYSNNQDVYKFDVANNTIAVVTAAGGQGIGFLDATACRVRPAAAPSSPRNIPSLGVLGMFGMLLSILFAAAYRRRKLT